MFLVVSRQILIDSRFSTVMCAPVYSAYDGFATQLQAGVEEGLAHESSIHCDEVVSLPKSALTDYVGSRRDPVRRDGRSRLSPSQVLPHTVSVS